MKIGQTIDAIIKNIPFINKTKQNKEILQTS